MERLRTKNSEALLAPLLVQVAELTLLADANGTSSPRDDDAKQAKECLLILTAEIEQFKSLHNGNCIPELSESWLEALRISGDSLVLAAEKIAALVGSISDDRPLSALVKKRLGKYMLVVAEAAAKILVLKEQVRCHEVVAGLQLLKSRLKDALAALDMDDLVSAFKCYSAVLVDALTRASRWQRDLSDSNAAAATELGALIADIRRSSGSLSCALQTRIACSGSEASMEMQSLMASDIIIIAEKMASIVLGELSDEALGGSWAGPGYFVRQMDEILEYLNSAEGTTCSPSTDRRPYEVLLESTVRHSTGVASALKEWTHATHGDRIVRSCASIFRLSRTMKKREKLVATAPNFHELRSELDHDRCALIGELHDLERYVNTALLEGIVSVFKETVEPLDRLVHAAFAHPTSGEKELKSSHMLKRGIQEFLDHANCVYLLAGFVADSSTEEERVRALKCSVANLKKIDPGILPAIAGCCQEESASVAGKKLQCLYRHWNRELQCLVTMIDEVTDPIMFVDISESQLARYVQELTSWQTWRTAPNGHSYRRFITTSRAVIGHSKRAAAAVKQAISCNKEPLLRRIMHAELSQLKQVIATACRICHVLSSESLWSSPAQAAEWPVECTTAMEELLTSGRAILDHLRMLNSCLSSGDPAELLHAAIVRNARMSKIDDTVLQPRAVDPATHDDARLSLHQVLPPEPPHADGRQQQSSSLGSGDGSRRANSRDAGGSSGHRRIESVAEQQISATVRAAMACDWARTEQLLKLSLLPWSRYVIDVAELLKSAYIVPPATRSALATGCSLLQELMPELLASSERIALLRSNDVSAFLELSHRWHATGAELETTCTFLVDSYDATCSDLVDSAERKEAQQFWGASQAFLQSNETFTSLLDAAAVALREAALMHCFSSDKPGSAIATSSAFSSGFDGEKVRDLGRLREQVLQAGQRILGIRAGVDDEREVETTDDERRVMRSVAVMWAACAICIESEATQHCDEACPYAFGGLDWRADGSLTDSARYGMAQQDLAHMVHVVCTRGGSVREIPDSALRMLAETEAILQCLIGVIDENGSCETDAAAAATATSLQSGMCIGRELRAALLRLRWRVKATSLHNILVDPVVTKLCRPLYTLAMAAAANGRQEPTYVGAAAVFSTDDGDVPFESLLRPLASGLAAVRSSIASAEAAVASGNGSDIGSSPASNPNASQMPGVLETARQCVDSLLAIVTSLLPPLLQSLAGDGAAAAVVHFKHIQRQWACHVLSLSCVLRDGSEQHTRDVRQHVSRWLRDLGIDPNAVQNSNRLASGVPLPDGANEGPAVSPASRAGQPRRNIRPMADSGTHSPTSTDSSIRRTARATSSSNIASPASVALGHATGLLDIEDNSWTSERNPTVRGVKEVAELLHTITIFGYDKGQLKGTRQLCRIARSAAEKSSVISEFAREVALRTRHERAAERLNKSAEKIQTLAAQMRVLSIAGQDTSDDVMTRKMLVQNASNLRQAVATTMLDIEATSIEGLDLTDGGTRNSSPIFDIISGWKLHLKNSRRINFNTCSLNDLGLRVQGRSQESPKLTDLILSAQN